ncbi:unnamed protein product, partial [marine sediment metagenome]
TAKPTGNETMSRLRQERKENLILTDLYLLRKQKLELLWQHNSR